MERKPNYCKYCGGELLEKKVEGKNRFYCRNCERVLWQGVTATSGVILKKEGKMLVVKRGIDPWKGKWSIPAGYMDRSEEPEETASRELEEETGIEVEPEDLEILDNIHLVHPDGKQVVVIVYRAENFAGSLEKGSEVEKAAFRDPVKLERAPLLDRLLRDKENE